MSTSRSLGQGTSLSWRTSSPAVQGKEGQVTSVKQSSVPSDHQTVTSSTLNDTTLRFINASHPSEVKSLQNRKLIKQHAMLDAQQRRREASATNATRKRALKSSQADNTTISPRQLLPKASLLSSTVANKSEPITVKVDPESPYNEEGQQSAANHTVGEPLIHDQCELSATILRYTGWSSVDPFHVLPQFSNPQIRVEKLQHLNMAFFPTLKRSQQYVNALISSPLVLLSDAHPGMILQDALAESPFGSNSSLAAKSELYNMINQRLRSPKVAIQSGRDVVAGIFNLIWLEMSYGNLQVIQTHIQGLRKVFQQLGGISKTGFDPNLMIMAVYQGLETAIYFEIPASVVDLRSGQALQQEHANDARSGPSWESPINSDDLSSTSRSSLCSRCTLHILRQVRRLTVGYFKSKLDNSAAVTFLQESSSIYQDLLRMNPATTPFLTTSGDWIYECVRITSIIWATAILEHLPISVAVSVAAVRISGTRQPVPCLVQALKKTSTQDCWFEMIGSFMWVCKVGCIAAPTGSVPFKWFYLEVARATVLGLRSRQYTDVLHGDETILRLQAALRSPRQSAHGGDEGFD